MAAEPCGGSFGVGGKYFLVDSSICKTEALQLYRLVDEMDFDFSRKVTFTPKDIADIYRISRQQQRDPWRICPNAGLLITTNVLVERLDEDNAKFTSTSICLKYRKRKRYLVNRVIHHEEEGELSYLEYLFKDGKSSERMSPNSK